MFRFQGAGRSSNNCKGLAHGHGHPRRKFACSRAHQWSTSSAKDYKMMEMRERSTIGIKEHAEIIHAWKVSC